MIQKELNEQNKEISSKAYELYEQHGFKDGNEFVDWLEAERLMGKRPLVDRRRRKRNVLGAIVGILCVIVAILLVMMFRYRANMEQFKKNLANQMMMLVLDPKIDEEIIAFGDTHFDYNKSSLTDSAKMLLDKEVRVLKENPKMKVRMAGYTSAQGTEEGNQKLSEERANAVKNYLIDKGIVKNRGSDFDVLTVAERGGARGGLAENALVSNPAC